MTLFARAERREGSPEDPRQPLTAKNLLEWFGAGQRSDAGIEVTPTGSLQMSTVYRCVSLIAGIGGELPLVPFRRGTFERVSSKLLDDPHPEYTPAELWGLLYCHRALWGNSYAQKVRNGAGEVVELWPLHPRRVRPGRATPNDDNPSGKVFAVTLDSGRVVPCTDREIFHVPHLGYDGIVGLSPVTLARQAIGLGLAAEEFAAKLFGSGNLLSGFISTEAVLKPEQAERIQQQWRDRMLGRHNQHDVAILDAGAKFQPLTMPLADAQFLESRQFQVPEIGRWFGVPPFLLFATEKSTSWGTGLEQQSIGFSMYDLGPQWLTRTEQRVSKELLLGEHEARYQRHRLLRGDSAARAAYYAQMRQWGGMTADEVRAQEDMPPLDEGGDVALQPLNMGPIGEPAAEPAADPPQPPPTPAAGDPNDGGDPT